MNLKIRLQLSAMMFFQFFIWSVWYVTMGPYLREVLKFTPQQVGMAYTATGWAAIISPFFVGMVADRFFATEKILATLHILGGLLMFGVSRATTFWVFYALLIGYTLCFMPTLALANTLALKQMTDPGKQFSRVAVLGTIGWIVAGQILGLFGARATTTNISFRLACGASFVMGLYSLTLPHTPPKGAGQPVLVRDVLGLDALRLLRDPSFAVFVISAFLFCIPLNLYFSFTPSFLEDLNISNIPGTMTLGQFSEMFFMMVMPFFLARLGVKWVFVLGMLGWSSRYLLFYLGYGSGISWPLYSGVALHGICYVFFFVLAYIYVDKKAPELIRTKAQGFISLVTLGAGFLMGGLVSGLLVQQYSFPNAEPAKFKMVQDASRWAEGDFARWDANGTATFGRIIKITRDSAGLTGPAATVDIFNRDAGRFVSSGQTATVQLSALVKPMTLWDKVWMLAAVSGLIIMVLFALLFRHKEEAKAAAPAEPAKTG
jgi:nucleoside transporter